MGRRQRPTSRPALQVNLAFYLKGADGSVMEKQCQLDLSSAFLTYEDLHTEFQLFLAENHIHYEAYMYLLDREGSLSPIEVDFELEAETIESQFDGTLIVYVRSYLSILREQMQSQMEEFKAQMENKLLKVPTKEEVNALQKQFAFDRNPLAALAPTAELDILVLFSEPIYDDYRKRIASPPVNFKAEIKRLQTALKSSYKPQISFRCEIATCQNLKYLLKHAKPRILHIICHGNEDGTLEFEDDSRLVLGNLQLMTLDELRFILTNSQEALPEVVFINSCHSEMVGRVFKEHGCPHVVMIDSKDKIDDKAAQVFSENFYRNLFKGDRVEGAFKASIERLKMSFSSYRCCCQHGPREPHKLDCKWISDIGSGQYTKLAGHNMFHVPSADCKCEMRNHNRHRWECVWARQALFQINRDFRIVDQFDGRLRFPQNDREVPFYMPKANSRIELMVCCCFNFDYKDRQNRLPHSESNKFKMLPEESLRDQQGKNLFQVSPGLTPQILDYTVSELSSISEKGDSAMLGRQQDLFDFLKKVKDLQESIFVLYGIEGVGRTTFAVKAATYLIERRAFQIFFYVDLFQIRNVDMFRYKLNEATKLNFSQAKQQMEIKNKNIIFVLDNCDEFLLREPQQLTDEIRQIRRFLPRSKIIITLKKAMVEKLPVNSRQVQFEKVELKPPLNDQSAADIVYSRLRNQFDVNVEYKDVRGVIGASMMRAPLLRNPKVIQSICQSLFGNKRITLKHIKEKIDQVLNPHETDDSGDMLLAQALEQLREKSQKAYELLLFVSQFSFGFTRDDFKVLSIYDSTLKVSGLTSSTGQGWEAIFKLLFNQESKSVHRKSINEIDEESPPAEIEIKQIFSTSSSGPFTSQDGDAFPSLNLNQFQSTLELSRLPLKDLELHTYTSVISQASTDAESITLIKNSSYFLSEIAEGRFVVKRFIRDYIQNRLKDSLILKHVKYLFISYVAVILDFYLTWMLEQGVIHEELLCYGWLCHSGIFRSQSALSDPNWMSTSGRHVKEHNNAFKDVVNSHSYLLQRIRQLQVNEILLTHKQDIISLYEADWEGIYDVLKSNEERKTLLCYAQNLLILIPTALKLARVEKSLLLYAISKSGSLRSVIKRFSNLSVHLGLKLVLMKLQPFVNDQNKDFQKQLSQQTQRLLGFHQNASKNSLRDHSELSHLWEFEKKNLILNWSYMVLLKTNFRLDRLKMTVESLKRWLQEDWSQCQPILSAKRSLILTQLSLAILTNRQISHTYIVALKNDSKTIQRLIQLCSEAEMIFREQKMIKLAIKSKISALSLSCQMISLLQKGNDQEVLLKLLLQLDKVENNIKERLNAQIEIKKSVQELRENLNSKIQKYSQNKIVFLRSVALSNENGPIIEHLLRRKINFKRLIQESVRPNQVRFCVKYDILSEKNLNKMSLKDCALLLLSTDFRMKDGRTYMVAEGDDLSEQLIEVNLPLIEHLGLKTVKILVLAGLSSKEASQTISRLIPAPPLIVCLYPNSSLHYSKLPQSGLIESLQLLQEIEAKQTHFFCGFLSKLTAKQAKQKDEIIQIFDKVYKDTRWPFNLHIEHAKASPNLRIVFQKGCYTQLKCGSKSNHNVETGDIHNSYMLRRCKPLSELFSAFSKRTDNKISVNIWGKYNSGKTCFVQQLAQMFIERKLFDYVYMVKGEALQKEFNGDLADYVERQIGKKRIFSAREMERQAGPNLLLILDDYHLVKSRSDGRSFFFQTLLEKQVSVLLVTMKPIQISKSTPSALKDLKFMQIQSLSNLEYQMIVHAESQPQYDLSLLPKNLIQCREIAQLIVDLRKQLSKQKENNTKNPRPSITKGGLKQ